MGRGEVLEEREKGALDREESALDGRGGEEAGGESERGCHVEREGGRGGGGVVPGALGLLRFGALQIPCEQGEKAVRTKGTAA